MDEPPLMVSLAQRSEEDDQERECPCLVIALPWESRERGREERPCSSSELKSDLCQCYSSRERPWRHQNQPSVRDCGDNRTSPLISLIPSPRRIVKKYWVRT